MEFDAGECLSHHLMRRALVKKKEREESMCMRMHIYTCDM